MWVWMVDFEGIKGGLGEGDAGEGRVEEIGRMGVDMVFMDYMYVCMYQ